MAQPMKRFNKETQDMMDRIRAIGPGFEFSFDGQNHVRVTHPFWGKRFYQLAATPGEWRSHANAYSDVLKLCREFGPTPPERRKAKRDEAEEARKREKRRNDSAAEAERLVRDARRRARRRETAAAVRDRERELNEFDRLMREGPA